MKDEQLKFLNQNSISILGCKPNATASVKPVATASTTNNVFTLSFSGSAATTGRVLVVRIEGTTLSFTTTSLQTATAAATAALTSWQSVLNTAFGTNTYTISRNLSTLTFTKNDGSLLLVEYYYSTDTAQKLAITSGFWFDRQILLNAKTIGTGEAKRYNDGYAVEFNLPNATRSTRIFATVFLANESGIAKSARWKVMWFYPEIGWRTDTTAGLMTISSTGAANTEITFGSSVFEAVGATRVAIALVDNNAAGALSDCGLYASAIVAN